MGAGAGWREAVSIAGSVGAAALAAMVVVAALGAAVLIRAATRRAAPKRPAGARVYVVLTRLRGDRGGRLGAALRAALQAALGPGAAATWRVAPALDLATAAPDAIERAEARLRRIAQAAGADVVLWGGVDARTGDALLRAAPVVAPVAAPVAADTPMAVVFGVPGRVAEEGFAAGLGEAAAASAAVAAGDPEALAAPARAALAANAGRPDPALSGLDRSRVREAQARLRHAEAGDDAAALARLALCDGRAAIAPAEAAAAQALLGDTLACAADEAPNGATLLEAVAALQAAAFAPGAAWSTRERARLRLAFAVAAARRLDQAADARWLEEALAVVDPAAPDLGEAGAGAAATPARLLRARLRAHAAARLGGTGRLEAAVEGYRDTLAALDPSAQPAEWTQAQAGLGRALAALGARRPGVAMLQEAVAAFDAARARGETLTPTASAAMAVARADALAAIGERSDGGTALAEATTALRGAITAAEAQDARLAAAARRTLARVERLAAERRAASAA